MAKQKLKKKKMTPRDTQINANVNAQETHNRRARSPCSVNREMGMEKKKKKKRFPDLLKAFSAFFSLSRAAAGCACAGPARAGQRQQPERSRLLGINPL